MTIINHSFKFVFVHVPKAAGTSITSLFSQFTNYCDLEIGGTDFGECIQPAYRQRFGLSKHSPARDLQNLMGIVDWSRYFTFAFVRNPFTRCLSTYHFLRNWDSPIPEFTARMRTFRSFEEYVLSDIWEQNNGPDEIFQPQVHWLCERSQSNLVLVDFIGHFEMIESDIENILSTTGLEKVLQKPLIVPKLNVSLDNGISESLPVSVVKKITKKYKVDFEVFGYSQEI